VKGSLVLTHELLRRANEEREEAGSLATLGMTSQKSKGKNNSNSRFPTGMTNQKSNGKNKGNSEGRYTWGSRLLLSHGV